MPQLKITDKKGLVQSTGAGVESDSLVVLKNSAGLRDSRSFRSATSGVARTGATATELSVNTHYVNGTATGLAMTIPSAASSNIGDWITVFYTTAVNNSANHTYTTTTDTAYALGSTITRIGGAVTSATDVSVAADNIITIAGTTKICEYYWYHKWLGCRSYNIKPGCWVCSTGFSVLLINSYRVYILLS